MWSFSQDVQSNFETKNNLTTFEDGQVISEISENLTTFEQSLENKGVESKKLSKNSQDGQVSLTYKENLTIFEENSPKSTNSTVETNCENNLNTATKKHDSSTVVKDCGEVEKSPESDNMVITTTVEEAQERVNRIIESKQERLERINRQKEENLKKVKRAEAK
jgi:formylmethanofuran dehydrogenase subunit A